ncbi:hypothetical protein GIB67_010147 [Kingdonia uniflora]|uniref:GATA transcription factor n=1 Tax=Kingdonia uniflora TaxID=39325 RepID=A0A7J7NAL2_9MAGN|nr:hypothetical protein GIB67_010147 [Kingdonia uniflora]
METPDFFYQQRHADPKSLDNFVIDDLFDFSNDDDNNTVIENNVTILGNSNDSSTLSVVENCNSPFSAPHFPDELCVPYDELAELEWLSNFVEESFSSEDLHKLQLISGMNTKAPTTNQNQNQNQSQNNASVFRPEMPVPGKARSKRSRAASCNWSSSRLLVISPTSSSSSELSADGNPMMMMIKKKEGSVSDSATTTTTTTTATVTVSDGRKCLHCATDKTPQWRTGPMGPKTLCNACGVRYKSGRLVPEYRPASSPTFTLAKHSNSHRKVLELRRQKEMKISHHQQFLYPSGLFDVSSVVVGGAGGVDDYLIHHHNGPDYRQLI